MIPSAGFDLLVKIYTEKKRLYREAIAAETVERDPMIIGGEEERATKLARCLSFGFMGTDGNEPAINWIELDCDQIAKGDLSEGTGWYVLVDGPWEHRSEDTAVRRARWKDPRDRDERGRDRDAEGARMRADAALWERSELAVRRAEAAKEKAEGKLAGLENEIDSLRDLRRADRDRIQELEAQIRDGGGTIRLIIETAYPFVQEAIELLKKRDERETQRLEAGQRKDKLAERLARSLELLGKFSEAVGEELPAASRNKRLRAIVREITEELPEEEEDEIEEPAEEPPVEVVAEPVTSPDPPKPSAAPPPPPKPPPPAPFEEEEEPEEPEEPMTPSERATFVAKAKARAIALEMEQKRAEAEERARRAASEREPEE